MKERVLIIAEAGVNHNGDMLLARRLVEEGAKAGADVVKFQTFKTELLVTKTAKQAEYQATNSGKSESQFEMLKRLELGKAAHDELVACCREFGVQFLSTAFDDASIQLLSEYQMPFWKVPSGELTNLPYLRRLGALKTKIILSTGMAVLSEIEQALEVLEVAGTKHEDITVLHCTTEYPTAWPDVNLRAMESIRVAFGVAVGYSDHTPGIEVPIAAVALGATVIEKHFTLDKSLPGPDHRASLEPRELGAMVSAIRNIEMSLGDGRKRPSLAEQKNKLVARKSLVAARSIRCGEPFALDSFAVKRPGSGLSPMLLDLLIGRPATRDFEPDELIEI